MLKPGPISVCDTLSQPKFSVASTLQMNLAKLSKRLPTRNTPVVSSCHLKRTIYRHSRSTTQLGSMLLIQSRNACYMSRLHNNLGNCVLSCYALWTKIVFWSSAGTYVCHRSVSVALDGRPTSMSVAHGQWLCG